MSSILWVGECAAWGTTDRPIAPEFALPLIEEEVLPVAFDPQYKIFRRLSERSAINCTSRIAQRVALASTGLNPKWWPWTFGLDVVVKAPASCANNGVRFFQDTEHVNIIRKYTPELAYLGVVEERINGGAYEIDGAVRDGKILFFNTLSQIWNESTDKIQEYRIVEPCPSLLKASELAIKALSIDNSCFCFEFRGDVLIGDWKLIDAHARLGEDIGLHLLMSKKYPLTAVEEFFA